MNPTRDESKIFVSLSLAFSLSDERDDAIQLVLHGERERGTGEMRRDEEVWRPCAATRGARGRHDWLRLCSRGAKH